MMIYSHNILGVAKDVDVDGRKILITESGYVGQAMMHLAWNNFIINSGRIHELLFHVTMDAHKLLFAEHPYLNYLAYKEKQ